MINPATIISKVDNFFGNIVLFNNSVIASIVAVESALGPGAASAHLALVASGVEAFTGQVGLAKQLVETEAATFGGIVTAFSTIVEAGKALLNDPTKAAPAAATT